MLDTGSAYLEVDPTVAAAYCGQVAGAVDASAAVDGSGRQFPCGTPLPDFPMNFNGNTVTIPNAGLAGGPVPNTNNMCGANLLGVAGRGTIGPPFWTTQYVMFNQADPSLSFAPQA